MDTHHYTHPGTQPQVQRTSGVAVAVLGLCCRACGCSHHHLHPRFFTASSSASSRHRSFPYLPPPRLTQTRLPHRHPSKPTTMAGGPVAFIKKRIYWYRLWTGTFLSCMYVVWVGPLLILLFHASDRRLTGHAPTHPTQAPTCWPGGSRYSSVSGAWARFVLSPRA